MYIEKGFESLDHNFVIFSSSSAHQSDAISAYLFILGLENLFLSKMIPR